MGCWNATCMLTKLPILSGEPCFAVFMVPRDRDHQDTVDSTGMYRPITPLIRGNYDEYGGMEYIQNLDSVQRCLDGVEFRKSTSGGEVEHIGTISEKLSNDHPMQDSVQEAILGLMENASRCDLEALIHTDAGKLGWTPVYLAIMKAPFVEFMIQANASDVTKGDVDDITFRLKTAGPLRDALRRVEAKHGHDMDVAGPEIPEEDVVRMYALIRAMNRMRIAFAPPCGSGGQDAMDDPWQREFHRKVWAAAEAMPLRYSEEALRPFYALASWDGRNLTTRTSMDTPVVETFMSCEDPDDLCRNLFERAARNLAIAVNAALEMDLDDD